MKANTLRECLVSGLFSSCLAGLLAQITLIYRDTTDNESFEQSTALQNQTLDDVYPLSYGAETSKWLDRQRNDRWIHIGIILKNIARPGPKAITLKAQFVALLRSLLDHYIGDRHLHFLFLTDGDSAILIDGIMRQFTRRVADTRVETTYYDVAALGRRFGGDIARMSEHFTSKSKQAEKYRDVLFMLAPFYHRMLPYDKIIFLDVDLVFRKTSLHELYRYFDELSADEVMSVGVDLSPHYNHVLRFYREENPDTHVGKPGRFQGFNTGVVLYDLDKMRASPLYNSIVGDGGDYLETLAAKYHYKSHLGDQCLFSLVGMEHPELFHLLPCEYNYQLDTSMYRAGFSDVFLDFHNCKAFPKIYHGNGGSPIPDNPADEALVLGEELLKKEELR